MNQTLLAGQEQAKAVTGRQEASKKHAEMILITQNTICPRMNQSPDLIYRLMSYRCGSWVGVMQVKWWGAKNTADRPAAVTVWLFYMDWSTDKSLQYILFILFYFLSFFLRFVLYLNCFDAVTLSTTGGPKTRFLNFLPDCVAIHSAGNKTLRCWCSGAAPSYSPLFANQSQVFLVTSKDPSCHSPWWTKTRKQMKTKKKTVQNPDKKFSVHFFL